MLHARRDIKHGPSTRTLRCTQPCRVCCPWPSSISGKQLLALYTNANIAKHGFAVKKFLLGRAVWTPINTATCLLRDSVTSHTTAVVHLVGALGWYMHAVLMGCPMPGIGMLLVYA